MRHVLSLVLVATVKKVAYGENSHRELYSGCCYGIHSEISSVRHLLRSKKTRNKYWNNKRITVNLMVIRQNSNGKLCSSKPCAACIKKLLSYTNIKIKRVYYSTSEGTIVMEKFNNLLDTTHKSRGTKNKQI
jgi:hypothetical protein